MSSREAMPAKPNAKLFLTVLSVKSEWSLDELYDLASGLPSDIRAHVPTLRKLAKGRQTVVEFGVRFGISTIALLAGRPKQLLSYDIADPPTQEVIAKAAGARWEFTKGDSRQVTIPRCEVLFIDTLHTKEQLRAELERHHEKVADLIVLHDTETFPELWQPIGWLLETGQWRVESHTRADNGLTILRRKGRSQKDRRC